MAETIGDQQIVMGVEGHSTKTETPPAPLPQTEPLTPGQEFALPADIGQMQEKTGYRGWLRQALKKVKAAVGLQGVSS
ncbi:hypothetical protein KKE48_01900 [Patescibacteria group bacterium]|nr:hypothetical protein [Patescibacteria group bacterium]MBU1499602.1 hypothetical protein [Patescibacteria group bacterium]